VEINDEQLRRETARPLMNRIDFRRRFWSRSHSPSSAALPFVRCAQEDKCDSFRGHLRVLVLPDAYDFPPRVSQQSVDPSISRDVRFDLLAPEGTVPFRPAGVLRAPVPEAAIDVDRDARSDERDICSGAKACDGRMILAVSQAAREQSLSKGNFGGGVLTADTLHACADFAIGGWRSRATLCHRRLGSGMRPGEARWRWT